MARSRTNSQERKSPKKGSFKEAGKKYLTCVNLSPYNKVKVCVCVDSPTAEPIGFSFTM